MAAGLERLRRVDVADVYKAGRLAAVLRRTPAGTVFSYREDFDGPPVATTLPLGSEPVLTPAGAVPAFFAGLLPEGRRLTALRTAVKTSADDELSLLLAVGRDTVGDVQVVPRGEAPDLPEPMVDAGGFDEVRFSDVLADAFGGRDVIDRVAIPGVQDKVSARMLAAPVAAAGGGFILKLDPPEFPHLVESEAFFLDIARRSGLPVADARVVTDASGALGLLVSRFDRFLGDDGAIAMRAQEDGCQVLGRYPADKYALTTEAVLGGLASVCRAAPVAALELLRQVAFAYLTGNGDQHAKNLSAGRVEGEWRATPLYDAPSSHPYGDTTMALTVAGRDRGNITASSFLSLGEELGLPPRAVVRALDRLVAHVDEWIDDLDRLPFDQRRRHRLRRLILDRAHKLSS
ncbi:MAG: type II toxin-antitoxin system HipA family toxin [Nitriliruptorales bacterium]